MFSKFLAGLALACLALLAVALLGGAFIADPIGCIVVLALLMVALLLAYRRRASALILVVAGAGVALSGCTGFASATPEQAATLVTALAKAGCSGSLDISAGAATGQLGGSVHAENTFHGACDPAKAQAAQSGASVGQVVGAPPSPAT